jgi:hypothetical protein
VLPRILSRKRRRLLKGSVHGFARQVDRGEQLLPAHLTSMTQLAADFGDVARRPHNPSSCQIMSLGGRLLASLYTHPAVISIIVNVVRVGWSSTRKPADSSLA